MKVIYCQPGEDPMEAARHYKTNTRGSGGNLMQYWWVLALVLFAVYTFTMGPLKPKEKAVVSTPNPQPTTQIARNTDLVQSIGDVFAGYCRNPAGGMFAPGSTVYLTDGDQIIQARCNNGEWETETETSSP